MLFLGVVHERHWGWFLIIGVANWLYGLKDDYWKGFPGQVQQS